jgi:cytochrome c556
VALEFACFNSALINDKPAQTMRKALFFTIFTLIALAGSAWLVQSMQAQSSRVRLMKTLSTQLKSLHTNLKSQRCDAKTLALSWQQLSKSSVEIDRQFAYVLQDPQAKKALSNLQSTLRQIPNCTSLSAHYQQLKASCNQCHQAIRGSAGLISDVAEY